MTNVGWLPLACVVVHAFSIVLLCLRLPSACVVASLCVATCCTLRRLNPVAIVDSSWSHAHNGGRLNELNNILNSFMFGFQCFVLVFSVQPFK